MPVRHLINDDGNPFDGNELKTIFVELEKLPVADRIASRNANALAIATHASEQILIVAGPGTGKSTIFKQRILHWLSQDTSAKVLSLSFVRKLVADLDADIKNDSNLTEAQKKQIDVFTLHKYARSVVEQNQGTEEWKFRRHLRIIIFPWNDIVWGDTLSLSKCQRPEDYSLKTFEKQIHEDKFDEAKEWKELKLSYFKLCRFYNAAAFSDLISRARQALKENPELNTHQYFVIDEYQDFNPSEENLLAEIAKEGKGRLLVGDDDQVLYEKLKSGTAALIRAMYKDNKIANAMLPFCGRCDFHITLTADHFIKQAPDPGCINKIYLPLSEANACRKVDVVACATPVTAVDYVRKFIEENKNAIEQRKKDLADGKTKDAFLLILSPSAEVKFYRTGDAKAQLFSLIEPYAEKRKAFSNDYHKLLNYFSLANFPDNNFTFRKLLHYENVSGEKISALIEACLTKEKNFADLQDADVKNILAKVITVKNILESEASIEEKLKQLAGQVSFESLDELKVDLEKAAIDKKRIEIIEHQEEEQAELEELEIRKMSAVELMTIVGSKGLSAEHVIILGFDDINMSYVTRNAFYVAMTRARKSLHLITALKAGGATASNQFLNDLPDANISFSSYKKSDRKSTAKTRSDFHRYIRSLGIHRGIRRL